MPKARTQPYYPDEDTKVVLTRHDTELETLRSSITAVGREVHELKADFSAGMAKIYDRLDSKNKINYSAIAVYLTIISMLAYLIWYPLSNEQVATKEKIAEIRSDIRSKTSEISQLASILGETKAQYDKMSTELLYYQQFSGYQKQKIDEDLTIVWNYVFKDHPRVTGMPIFHGSKKEDLK